MQTEGVEKKGICYPVHFDPAVLVEENGDEIILFQREEGSWLKMSKKLYRNICWHLEHNQEFLPEYDRILKSLNKCNILANKKQKRLENVTVMLTDKCNLACKHCCASELSSSRDISFSILRKIIELECQTAHYGRCEPHFDFGRNTSLIVPHRYLTQIISGITADCRSLV